MPVTAQEPQLRGLFHKPVKERESQEAETKVTAQEGVLQNGTEAEGEEGKQ